MCLGSNSNGKRPLSEDNSKTQQNSIKCTWCARHWVNWIPPSLKFKWQKKLTLRKVLAKGHFINLLSGEIAQKLGRKPRYEDCYVVVVVHNTVLLPRIQCILHSLTYLKLMQSSSAKCMLCAENSEAHHGPCFLGVSTYPRVFHPHGYFWMYFLSGD